MRKPIICHLCGAIYGQCVHTYEPEEDKKK